MEAYAGTEYSRMQIQTNNPLAVRSAGITGLFAPQLFARVGYYAAMAGYTQAVIDTSLRYDKRFKSAHRYTIIDTRDNLDLTVPIKKPEGNGNTWDSVYISSHGHWWDVHRTALESAYGRTPFFEFYFDRFSSIFQAPEKWDMETTVGSLIRATDSIIRNILGIRTSVSYTDGGYGIEAEDLRKETFSTIPDIEYYQVRANKLGFRANLSILDLIFNMGTEAPLILKKIQPEIF